MRLDPLGLIRSRRQLAFAILAGTVVFAVLASAPIETPFAVRALVAWVLGCLAFIGPMLKIMSGQTAAQMRDRAADQDQGAGLILTFVVASVAVSLGAIVAVMAGLKGASLLHLALGAGLSLATIAASWFLIHLVFALHYAHAFYGTEAGGKDRGGLKFPGGGLPDYWDFLHFAIVIGVAAQTADITFTSKPMRRIGTAHSAVAFVFNTVILAMGVGLLASLFS